MGWVGAMRKFGFADSERLALRRRGSCWDVVSVSALVS
jgi:hypothetical protein